jgi:2-polyprenyl-3-methyl-5-hydroxy-6-metoxy-1,4-benzoquinol methylase
MRRETTKQLLQLVRDNYQEIAGDFSQTRRKEIWPAIRILAAEITDGETVLDLGCGNGRLCEALADRPIDYLGLDGSAKLIDLARQLYPGKKFIVGDLLNLANDLKQLAGDKKVRSDDEKFNQIFCLAVLQHIPSSTLRVQILKAIKETLKPGGRVVISVWNLWSPVWRAKGYRWLIIKSWLGKISGRQDLDFGDVIFPWKNPNGQVTSQRYYHAFTGRELTGLAKQAGFMTIKIIKDDYNYWLILG